MALSHASQIMELYGQTKSARISGRVPCWIRVSWSAWAINTTYRIPVVPPERQQEALYEYLKKEGFACRKDITTALQIETEQCSAPPSMK